MTPYVLVVVVVLASLAALRAMGRVWGEPRVWTSAADGPSTSQRLADPYTLSHVLHGFAFYALLAPFRLALSTKLLIAVALECAWELAENTPAVIQKYRTQTVSREYTGDSVLNSFGDIASMALGFFVAHSVSWPTTVGLTLLVELGMLAKYRDNLTLNVVQLLAPNPRITAWQQRVKT